MWWVRDIIGALVRNDVLWAFLRPVSKIGVFLQTERNKKNDKLSIQQNKERLDNLFAPIIQQRIVLNGPFKGLKYPQIQAFGSALYPKLIGSYEMELHTLIEELCQVSYSEIINIGSGEGYYAVGLARRISNSTVYAFDIDEMARVSTIQMAKINGVESRVKVDSVCTLTYLSQFSFTQRGLIVCDCEGFESSLFNATNLDNLQGCDLLIETHDFVDINISTYLKSLFSESHSIASIKSLDDIEKAKTYRFEESDHYDLKAKKELFREGRPAIMEWFFLTPKK